MGDLAAVRAGTTPSCAPPTVVGCRALVDSGSLLWRWALTPARATCPTSSAVAGHRRRAPWTPPTTLHGAALGGHAVLRSARSTGWTGSSLGAHARRPHVRRGRRAADARRSPAAGGRATRPHARRRAGRLELSGRSGGLGGSDAQREVVEDTRIAALLAAGAGTTRRGRSSTPGSTDRRLRSSRRGAPAPGTCRRPVAAGTQPQRRRSRPDHGVPGALQA